MDNSPDFLTHYEMKLTILYSMVLYCNQTELHSWTKVLGHFCISGAFSNSHRPNASPHPTNNVGRMYPGFFYRFSTLHRLGGGRTAIKFRKGCTLLWRNPEITEKCEYCITFSRTFVHDCSLTVREWKQLGLSRWNLLSNTLFSVMLLTILYKVVPTVGSVGEILKRDY